MWSQLARVEHLYASLSGIRTLMNQKYMGPMDVLREASEKQLKLLGPTEKHWYIGGNRSVMTAVTLLKKGEIIAVPTDTVFGFAGCVENYEALQKLYEIKRRSKQKPLAICVANVKDIEKWGVTSYLPPDLITHILPGPFTIVLERTAELNPALNPGVNNVGIRVPDHKFLNIVCKLAGPLALTSANESNKPNSSHPNQFSNLWPQLGGIFYEEVIEKKAYPQSLRGSTIIDLSRPGYYKILREGVGLNWGISSLKTFKLKPSDD